MFELFSILCIYLIILHKSAYYIIKIVFILKSYWSICQPPAFTTDWSENCIMNYRTISSDLLHYPLNMHMQLTFLIRLLCSV